MRVSAQYHPKMGKWISVWQHWLVHLDLSVLDFLMMMTMTMLKMTRIMMKMCGSRQRQTHLHRKQSLPNIDCTGAALVDGDEEK